MLFDKHIIASSILVGGFNGILFSYYSESPYIFIELFNISSFHYGMLGIFMGTAVFLGSLISKKINNKIFSCYTNLIIMVFFSFLTILNVINNQSILSIILIVIFMMLFYVNFGISIPNILSKALICYKDNIGSASSIFGFIYYFWISLFVFGIGALLPNSLLIMPFYFGRITKIMK